MAIMLRIPVCNIMACEDIAVNNDSKIFICNPFTGTAGKNIKKFYTYTVIQGVPNGKLNFKIQIISPNGSILKETDENSVTVEENIVRAKTQWSNINFIESGDHTVRVMIKCNNGFEVIGTTYLYIM